MTIDKATIASIANLARLEIAEDNIERYQKELSNILSLVAQMDAIDTQGVEPMTHPFDAILRLRDDEVTESNQRDKYQSLAPQAEAGYYLVPKVID